MKHKAAWISVFVIGLLVSTSLFYATSDGQTSAVQTITHNVDTPGQTSATVYGQDDNTPCEDKAEINIKAPDKVKVGDMIVIDLSESLGGGFDYEVEPTPPGLRTFDNGKIIVCGTGSKNVTYIFSISCALKGDSDIAVHKIKVTGAAAPGPPVDPGHNIVEKVKDWAADVTSPTLRDDAMKLAQSFASVAVVIEQDTFNDAESLIIATAASNRDALNGNIENWTPLLNSLMGELKAMARLGKLLDVTDHAPIWRDVAKGLREFAATLN